MKLLVLALVALLAVSCLAGPVVKEKDDSPTASPSSDSSSTTGPSSDSSSTVKPTTDTHWYDGIVTLFGNIFPAVGLGSHGKLTNYPNGNQNKVGANQKLSLDIGEKGGTVELDYRRDRKSDSDWIGVGYKYPLGDKHYAFVKVENNLEEGNSSFIWDFDGKYDKNQGKHDKDREEAYELREQRDQNWENSLNEQKNKQEEKEAGLGLWQTVLKSHEDKLKNDVEEVKDQEDKVKTREDNVKTREDDMNTHDDAVRKQVDAETDVENTREDTHNKCESALSNALDICNPKTPIDPSCFHTAVEKFKRCDKCIQTEFQTFKNCNEGPVICADRAKTKLQDCSNA